LRRAAGGRARQTDATPLRWSSVRALPRLSATLPRLYAAADRQAQRPHRLTAAKRQRGGGGPAGTRALSLHSAHATAARRARRPWPLLPASATQHSARPRAWRAGARAVACARCRPESASAAEPANIASAGLSAETTPPMACTAASALSGARYCAWARPAACITGRPAGGPRNAARRLAQHAPRPPTRGNSIPTATQA
jgi:hypothetical protein